MLCRVTYNDIGCDAILVISVRFYDRQILEFYSNSVISEQYFFELMLNE